MALEQEGVFDEQSPATEYGRDSTASSRVVCPDDVPTLGSLCEAEILSLRRMLCRFRGL